jgi:hypothetical protein
MPSKQSELVPPPSKSLAWQCRAGLCGSRNPSHTGSVRDRLFAFTITSAIQSNKYHLGAFAFTISGM